MKRKTLIVLLIALGALVALVPGAIGSRQATKIRICYANAATNYAPMWIALKEGYFEQEGLDASVFQAAGRGSQILQSGDCQISLDSAVPNILAVGRGADFVMVGAQANRFGFKLLVRTDRGINKVADLKGKKLAVSAPQAAVDQAGRALLKNNGLEPGRDVDIVSIPSISSRLAALSSGTVDAMIASPPVKQITQDGKTKELLDLSSLRFVLVGDWARRGYAVDNPDVIKGYLRSILRANRWLKDPANRTNALKYIGEVTGITDQSGLIEAYDYEFKVHQEEPVVSQVALRNSLKYVEDNFNVKVDQNNFLYLKPLTQVLTYTVSAAAKGASGGTFSGTLTQAGQLNWRLVLKRPAAIAYLQSSGAARVTLCAPCKKTQSGTKKVGSGVSKAVKHARTSVNIAVSAKGKVLARAVVAATPGR
jgi:ABC-type nitrate/sulfonate/bicarbonate transport system substrate-binding protein